MLACVPLTAAELRGLPDAPLTDVAAHAPTPALMAAHGYAAADDEDADFASLTYASVACLRRAPRRLVATAEVPDVADPGDDLGAVTLPRLAWSDVTGLFVDEPLVADLAAAAHAAATAAPDLEAALETGPVSALLAEADLLWYAPEEHADVLTTLED